MAYNKLIDLNLLSNFLSKIKNLIPTKTSDLENDSEYITGMEILSYGNSTWNDFLTAYTAKKVVYCRASSNSNPASGSQTRLAFMAYVNNADNPTNVEFQYYRSVSSHTSTQQGDQVFVYKLDKTSGWSVTTREASSKVVAGTNMTSSYSNDTVTLNANIPSNVSDLTNDSGYITGITSSDVTTALGYTPSSTDTTYSAGNGIDITNTIIKNTQGIEYIVGTQIASTAAWTGNSTDEALYIGKIIAYYLPFAGTSTAATLTLTMANGATTEAIPLRRVASSTVTTQFAAGNIIVLIYDGTYWRVSAYHNSSDTNTIPTGYCTTGASTAAKSANCTYGYRDDTNYFPCLFRYANTAANATLAIASYATTALPIYVNGERTSATNTFGAGVILFLYYNGAYYCYNDGRLPILVNGVVTSVQDYTNELKNTINEVSQVITSTNIDSTSIATFDASAANMPLKGLTVNIEPVQDLHGYDHPWPGGSRKNLLNIDDLIAAPSGTFGGYTFKHKLTLIVSPNTQYTLSTSYNGTGNVLYFNGASGSGNCVKADAPKTSQSSKTGELTILLYDRDGISSFENKIVTVQLEEGSTATTYEPYSNICPISGWTGANVSRTGKNYIDGTKWNVPNSTMAYVGITNSSESISAPAGEYTFSFTFKNNVRYRVYFIYSESAWDTRRTIVSETGTSEQATLTVDGRPFKIWFYATSGSVSTDNIANVQLESGANRTEFEPYFGTAISITFPSEAGTVYGGTLDVVSGKMVVDRASIVVSDATIEKRSTNYANWRIIVPTDAPAKNNHTEVMVFSSNYKGVSYDGATAGDDNYAFVQNGMYIGIKHTATAELSLEEYKSQYGDARFVYYLDTPITYHLTPQEITTLLGTNSIWADCGDVTVTYGAYLETVKAYIDQSITDQDLINNTQNERIEDLEQTTTAIAINPSAIVTFEASAANMPLKGLTVNIEPVQSGTGDPSPDNVRPISGWTGCRVFYPDLDITRDLAIVKNKYINTSGVETDSTTTDNSHTDYFPVTPGETLYFSAYWDEIPDTAPAIAFYDADKNFVSPRKSFVTANNSKGVVGYNFATLTVPNNCYYAILNFSYRVRDRMVLTDKDPTITFPSTLDTVYGGIFDVANKKLIIDRAIVDLGSLTWSKTDAGGSAYYYRAKINNMPIMTSRTMPVMSTQFISISDGRDFADCPDQSIYNLDRTDTNIAVKDMTHDTASDFKTAVTGAMLVYPLTDPIEIPITSAPDITTTFGTNNIWADCGDVTVIYGEYLTQIKNNINDLDKRVKIIEDNDPLFDKLIHLPDDDSFFDKQGITTLGTYTKIDKHTFKISGGSGTAYYSYPLHGTNKVIWGTNTQMLTRLTPSDFAPIPASGSWGNTTYSVGMRVYSETNTTNSNRNLEIDLWAANIQNGEFIGEPVVIASCIPTNYTKYCTTILKLRGTGFGPLSQYTHYAIFARSRSRASSAEAIIRLETVQSPRLMQYILYPTSAIETSLTATAAHAPNSFILNNDRLYKVLTQIQTGEEIVVGTNVEQVSILEVLTSLLNNTANIPNTSSISNNGLISIKHDSTELFTIQLPLYNGGVSNGT